MLGSEIFETEDIYFFVQVGCSLQKLEGPTEARAAAATPSPQIPARDRPTDRRRIRTPQATDQTQSGRGTEAWAWTARTTRPPGLDSESMRGAPGGRARAPYYEAASSSVSAAPPSAADVWQVHANTRENAGLGPAQRRPAVSPPGAARARARHRARAGRYRSTSSAPGTPEIGAPCPRRNLPVWTAAGRRRRAPTAERRSGGAGCGNGPPRPRVATRCDVLLALSQARAAPACRPTRRLCGASGGPARPQRLKLGGPCMAGRPNYAGKAGLGRRRSAWFVGDAPRRGEVEAMRVGRRACEQGPIQPGEGSDRDGGASSSSTTFPVNQRLVSGRHPAAP